MQVDLKKMSMTYSTVVYFSQMTYDYSSASGSLGHNKCPNETAR